MSARSAGILLVVLLLTPSAEAGWFGGDSYGKKLPKPIKMAEIRPHDAARLARPSRAFSRIADPRWGALGPAFYQASRLRVQHQLKF